MAFLQHLYGRKIKMFKAMIVACVIGSPDNCMEVSDTYGPYRRQEECLARVGKMQHDLKGIWKEYNMPFEIKQIGCLSVDGELT